MLEFDLYRSERVHGGYSVVYVLFVASVWFWFSLIYFILLVVLSLFVGQVFTDLKKKNHGSFMVKLSAAL